MALRDLLIRIDHDIDLSGLEEAQEMIDEYRDSYIELEQDMQNMGDTGVESMDDLIESTEDADKAIQQMGETGTKSADEITTEFKKTEASLEDISEAGTKAFSGIQSAIAGIVGLGISGYFFNAASNLEMAKLRMEAFASTEGDLDRLNRTIQNTIAMSKGVHREGDLAEAAHQALMLGMSMDNVSDTMQDAAVIAAVTGDDISRVMRQIGRSIEIGAVRQLQEMGVITSETFAKIGEEQAESIRSWDRQRRELLVMTGVQDYAARKMDWYNQYLETADAKTKSLSQSINDLAEAAGTPLLKPLTDVTDILKEFTDGLDENQAGMLGWGALAGGVVASVWGLATGLILVQGAAITAGVVLGEVAIVLGAILGIAILLEDLVRGIVGLPSVSGDIMTAGQNALIEALGVEGGVSGLSDTQYALAYPIRYGLESAGLRKPRDKSVFETAEYSRRNREHPAFAPTIQINVDGNTAGSPGIESKMKRIAEQTVKPMLEKEWRNMGTQLNNTGAY